MILPVYMDCHSTTATDAAVVASMAEWWSASGNAASTTHQYGAAAAKAVELGRRQTSSLIGASDRSVVFTSGATESNNLAILGLLRGSKQNTHLITGKAEHRSVLDPSAALVADGYQRTILPVDATGQVAADQVAKAIRPNTTLVSIVFSNSEVGTTSPIADIGSICRDRGVVFHTDATQAVGRLPIDVSELPIDLVSFSAHKMHGPKGIGALYVRNDDIRKQIQPLIYGGGHERGLRSGTLPVPLIVGFGRASQLCQELMADDATRIEAMRDRLWERFQSEIPDVVLNGHPTDRLYNNLNVSFLGVPSEAFMIKLRDVVAVSAGSACTSANPEPSHVLRAMGVGHERLESAIRFGLGRFNTMEEVEFVADNVRDAVSELRRSL